MARPLRIEYPGALYHVTCRGNERKDIFKDDADRSQFLRMMSQSVDIYAVKLSSYVLMNNHFHLLIETPRGNLSEFMRHFNITYTGYYNRRHKRVGHLYQGRYKSLLVDRDAYLSVLSRYIHLNPVRFKSMKGASFKEKIRFLNAYPWSSLAGYLTRRRKESFIDYSMVLGEYGGDTGQARRGYRKALIADMVQGIEIKGKILGQCVLGAEDFIERVRERYLTTSRDRERPAVKEIHAYCSKDAILGVVERETGKGVEEIKREKGVLRQMVMELLYRVGGLTGVEIGTLMGVGYTSVSQERRRLRERLGKERKLEVLLNQIETKCHD